MKVTTEGCILGAWVDPNLRPERILDIGTGTGLLALMLAQKFPQATIDAVEVDHLTCLQAKHNFNNSPWTHRLRAHHFRVQDFEPEYTYDLIIVNPPFFRRSLLSPYDKANLAKHDTGLTQPELISSLKRLLNPDGTAYVLYPPTEANLFLTLAGAEGLFLHHLLKVYQVQGRAKALRWMGQYKLTESTVQEKELVIRQLDGAYTPALVELLKPYYLYL